MMGPLIYTGDGSGRAAQMYARDLPATLFGDVYGGVNGGPTPWRAAVATATEFGDLFAGMNQSYMCIDEQPQREGAG